MNYTGHLVARLARTEQAGPPNPETPNPDRGFGVSSMSREITLRAWQGSNLRPTARKAILQRRQTALEPAQYGCDLGLRSREAARRRLSHPVVGYQFGSRLSGRIPASVLDPGWFRPTTSRTGSSSIPGYGRLGQ